MENNTESVRPILKSFYQNFIAKELEKEDLSDEYLAILKIVWVGFEDIANKTKISRRLFILELIEKYLIDKEFHKLIDETELPTTNAFIESQNLETPQIKVKQIDLVNFRGFRVNISGNGRKILFDEKATLFFAPNGGGKTSLCEALEWVLTGDTKEHVQRSVLESADKYFQNRNVDEPNYKNTKIALFDDSDTQTPDFVFDRCFLEKNRIEKFAKLATQPGKDVQEILGELFGLSEIVNFFKEFGQDLSPTTNEKDERQNWQTWLDWGTKKRELESIIEESNQEERKATDELSELLGDKSYHKKREKIQSEIKKLSIELESLGSDPSMQFSAINFLNKRKRLIENIKQWKECKNAISQYANDLDFESLYQAANKIFRGSYIENKCPLCDTPIVQEQETSQRHHCVVTDPRIKTKNELKKLETLTKLKSDQSTLESDIRSQIFPSIKKEWSNIQHNLKDNNWKIIADNTQKPELPDIDVIGIEASIYSNFQNFASQCETAFNADFSKINTIEEKVLTYTQKREKLQQKKQEQEETIQKLQETYDNLQKSHENLSNKRAIKEKNELRLQNLMKQSDNSVLFKKLLGEYDKYYASLQDFQSGVILTETEDIDEFVTGFYRALNLHDHDSELIKSINFPKRAQEDFCLTYEKDNSAACNALQVLSEGHLKTLGLASLLARSTKLNTCLLVFDDAINAVDSDHRDNIAHLISGKFTEEQGQFAFGDKWEEIKEHIETCQFIITSHDRFFDEKLANLFDKESQIRYVLYNGKYGIDFCEKGVPANFEAKIETYLNPDTQDIRSAIFYCRIWLEEILLSVAINFKKPSNNRQIEFTNVVDRKTKSLKNPELTTLIDSLISNLNIDGTSDDDKEIADILKQIKQEKNGKYVWFFDILNQESHYRRYDHVDISNAPTSQEVETIYNNIQKINSLMSNN